MGFSFELFFCLEYWMWNIIKILCFDCDFVCINYVVLNCFICNVECVLIEFENLVLKVKILWDEVKGVLGSSGKLWGVVFVEFIEY